MCVAILIDVNCNYIDQACLHVQIEFETITMPHLQCACHKSCVCLCTCIWRWALMWSPSVVIAIRYVLMQFLNDMTCSSYLIHSFLSCLLHTANVVKPITDMQRPTGTKDITGNHEIMANAPESRYANAQFISVAMDPLNKWFARQQVCSTKRECVIKLSQAADLTQSHVVLLMRMQPAHRQFSWFISK